MYKNIKHNINISYNNIYTLRTYLTSNSVDIFNDPFFFEKIFSNNDNTRWLFDKTAVEKQMETWTNSLPWIRPYYAMKANPSPELLATLMSDGKVGIDVASLQETKTALNYTNKDNIIYTNPHIIPYEITSIKNAGIPIKVVDSMNEMKKLVANHFFPDVLIRLNSNIYEADCTFDSKFGCDINEALSIMEYAKSHNICIRGISFHIGSGGKFDRNFAYQKAIAYAGDILDNIENPILDLGGGLLYDTDLEEALGWTQYLPYRIIAEPGRYYAEPAYHLKLQVIAKTDRGIFLDNGVYQELNVYHRDHWQFPILTHYYDHETGMIEEINKYTKFDVFGPTCDSYDVIQSVLFPADIQTNDYIFLSNMGAYTSAGAVDFNGIVSASNSN
jgi:ornithine decarboxylase